MRLSAGKSLILSFVLLAAASGCDERDAAVDWSRYPFELRLADRAHGALPLAATVSIDLGEPEARHHLLEGWSGGEVYGGDGSSFVWGLGEESTLRFVRLAPRTVAVTARCMGRERADGSRPR